MRSTLIDRLDGTPFTGRSERTGDVTDPATGRVLVGVNGPAPVARPAGGLELGVPHHD